MANIRSLKSFKAELLAERDRAAYEELVPEYEIARAVVTARTSLGITQEALAGRMKTSQSYIARQESGRVLPSMRTLIRVAKAMKARPRFTFIPD